jgi:hypothetical protein
MQSAPKKTGDDGNGQGRSDDAEAAQTWGFFSLSGTGFVPKVWPESHDLCIRANCFLGFKMPQAKNQELGHSSQGKAAPCLYVT